MPHTPGPWKVDDFSPDAWWLSDAISGPNGPIAYTADRSADGDAILIAQAPAMYELLKELEFTSGVADPVAFCQFCGTDEGKEHSSDCKLAAVLKAVEGEE